MKNILSIILKFIFSFIYTEKIHNLKNKIYISAYSTWLNKKLGTKKVRGMRGVVVSDNVKIGENSTLKEYVVVFCQSKYPEASISIGENAWIGDSTFITCINSITIGNNFTTGRFCLITDNSHGEFSKEDLVKHPMERKLVSKGPVVIGDNVWIGEGVTICANVKIGNFVTVAANSVVTHDIPDFCMVAGSPAKVIKTIQ